MGNLYAILSVLFLCGTMAVSAQPPTEAGRILNTLKTATGGRDTVAPKDEVAAGLREALTVGANRSVGRLSAVDGYFGNAALRILLPPEAQKVEQRLRSIGMGRQVDNVILSMNRAAEDAAKSASPIFVKAIREMTLPDALSILRGNDTAATAYLQTNTLSTLTTTFRPIIDSSLRKVDASRHWNTIFTTYNRVAREKVDPDLASWVTTRALQGIFNQLANEERLIRKDPVARSSELLRRVFRQ